ncbi:MAG TPA: DnaJ domain-containing protein [Beijerinckiaceae bacterium]|nr:DnaJ domain-containing protein [Beijerinckiaceae bacterium]HVB89176.1 DnaJ domain-containing protein [Beijerinckiaceae bacterium]
MPELLIAALILWGLVVGLKWFAHANPATLAKAIKRGGGLALLLVAGLLLIRGSVEAAAGVGGLGLWLFGWIASPSLVRGLRWGPGASRSRKSAGGASKVRSALLEMELDHDTGAMRGRVLAGAFAGTALADLSQPQCEDLLSSCRAGDPESARLLEAYLDRRFSGWRAAGESHRDPGREGRGARAAMSKEDAYQMLGLAQGAPREEIARAHRSLMKKVHPDHGGTTSLAALLNEAKDVLMRGHDGTPGH